MTITQWRMSLALCLIVAGALNALASVGYLAGGFAAKWLVAWNVDFWFDLWGEQGGAADPATRNQAETLSEYVGTVLLYWAAILAASAPLLIAGGIQALRGMTPWLIATAGYLGFVLELLGVAISGIGLLHLPGLAAGPLAYITLRKMREAQRKTPARAGVSRVEHDDDQR
jgi:hypothetical protein